MKIGGGENMGRSGVGGGKSCSGGENMGTSGVSGGKSGG